jgi:hypothetical protein
MEANNPNNPGPESPHDSIPNWVPYDVDDREYFGAAEVVEAERTYIRAKRPATERNRPCTGLALSGGGIRSASFCLGAMQALSHQGWLGKIDYLSTVSGGGYIGASVSWLVHRPWTVPDPNVKGGERTVRFGMGKTDFPYGTYPMSGTRSRADTKPSPADGMRPSDKGSMLRFVRQNAKYLVPGNGINLLSLVAAVLRGGLVSVAAYFGLLVLAFLGLHRIGFFEPVPRSGIAVLGEWATGLNWPLFLAGLCGVVFLVFAFAFTLLSWVRASYGGRRAFDVGAKNFLIGALVFLLLWALPQVPTGIGQVVQWFASKPSADAAAAGSLTDWLGAVSALLGVLSAAAAFARSGKKQGTVSLGTLVTVAVALLLFGLLLLGYRLSERWYEALRGDGFGRAWLVAAALAIVILGFVASLNRVSIHRFYRDRLMETFLPDVDNALRATGNRPHARDADRMKLSAMANAHAGPYHLINTNVVLVGSQRAKFKGRGGDNFVLSPLYCGSNATGWRNTRSYANDDMTLASAMATSGAAVNPSAGCGGEGVTRNALMSMLMGLLNIRLGYWTLNPDPQRQPRLIREPNHWVPGLWEVLVRSRLSEENRFLQLSDGGHFENLGLYELIRRKPKVIIVCDGAADPGYAFADLANALEKIRVEFGVLVDLDSTALRRFVPRPKGEDKDDPKADRYAETGHLIADITYADETKGKLIYLTTTFFEGLPADLYGYRREHPEFPDEPTSDQFFDEKQFEAYRELGFSVALEMMCDPAVGKDKDIVSAFGPYREEYCKERERRRKKLPSPAGKKPAPARVSPPKPAP